VSDDNPAESEARARRSLGLTGVARRPQFTPGRGAESRGRHRFVQDGEVPVTVLSRDQSQASPWEERLAAAQKALLNERAQREAADRALGEAQATIRSLQTRLVHAEMAAREATEAASRLREQVAQDALRPPPEPRAVRVRRPRAETDPEASDSDDEEPVQWWVPGWRAREED
jgi:hypothetical protein